jgi:hypothetical protein
MRIFGKVLLAMLVPLAVVGPVTAAIADTRPDTTAEANAGAHPAVVLPPNARPYGKTYGQWSAVWWKYVLEIPASTNPLKDTVGTNCAVQQSGPVFFLGGLWNTGGSVIRNCTVPHGKALFFPIRNCEADNTVAPGGTRTTYTAAELLALCQQQIDNAHDLSASLDGKDIPGLNLPSIYRASSPPFSVVVPTDSLFEDANEEVTPGEVLTPIEADGIYLMLAPLTAGHHVLLFHAADLALDVTYNLTIG